MNLWAQLAYFSYGLADLLVLPDVGWFSLLIRAGYAALTLPVVWLVFTRSKTSG